VEFHWPILLPAIPFAAGVAVLAVCAQRRKAMPPPLPDLKTRSSHLT
jgi:hypothetical protein